MIDLSVLQKNEIDTALLQQASGDVLTAIISFSFDDTDWLSVNKQHIVRRAHIRLILPHGNARSGPKIDAILALHNPASLTKLFVNAVPGHLLRVLVVIVGGHLVTEGRQRKETLRLFGRPLFHNPVFS